MPFSVTGAWRNWAEKVSCSHLDYQCLKVKQCKPNSHNVLRQKIRFFQGSVMREGINEGKLEYYLSKNSKLIKNFEISIVAMTVLVILLTLSEILCLKYLRCRFWMPLMHTAVSMPWQPTRFIFIGLVLGLMDCVYFISASYSTEGVVIQ